MEQNDPKRVTRSYSAKPFSQQPSNSITQSSIQRRPSLPARTYSRTKIESSSTNGTMRKLPPLPRGSLSSTSGNGTSNGVRFSVADADETHRESATSSSTVHGAILTIIMLSSFVAFLFSKIKDPCEDFFLLKSPSGEGKKECSATASLLFSIANIIVCVFCFVTYFLHLIGQCDHVILSVRRKFFLEICAILGMTLFLASSLIYAMHSTALLYNGSLAAIILSSMALVGCVARTVMLLVEARRLWSHGVCVHCAEMGEASMSTSTDATAATNPVALRSVLTKSISNSSGSHKQKIIVQRQTVTSSSGSRNGSCRSSAPAVAYNKSSTRTKNSGGVDRNGNLDCNDSDDDVFVDIAI